MIEGTPDIELLRTGELYVNGFHVADVQPRTSPTLHATALHDLSYAVDTLNDSPSQIADLREKLEDRMALYINDETGGIHLDGYDLITADTRYDQHSVRVGDVREVVAVLLQRLRKTENNMDISGIEKALDRIATGLEAMAEAYAKAAEGSAPSKGKKGPTAAEKKAAKEAADAEAAAEAEAKAKAEAEAAKGPTKDEVLAAMTKAAEFGGRGAVIDVLKTFSATKVSEVPEDKWADLLAAIQEVKAPESFE